MLECALINHGSPTLARLKTGSMFALGYDGEGQLEADIRRVNDLLRPKGVMLTPLLLRPERALLYLYRERELTERLSQEEVQGFLRAWGYDAFGPEDALQHLRHRLMEQEGFPHEVGVFLGYPLADVIGFIQNAGRNCLCCGCWKAYSNEREAQRIFARYRKCREVYTRLFAQGFPLSRLTVTSFP